MKITLGMICQNEEYYLSLILPIIRPCFDEFIAVDGGSKDGTKEVLKKHGCKVIDRPWDGNHSNAQNEVIKHVSNDWVCMLDADEAMFPKDIEKMKTYMEENTCISIPRVEFVEDHLHYDPKVSFTGGQNRVFKLGYGYHFRAVIHKDLYRGDDPSSVSMMGIAYYATDCPMYHYGQCKPRHQVWLKHHNYALIHQGQAPLSFVPPGMTFGRRTDIVPYPKDHPLKGHPSQGQDPYFIK
jgi:glycosyltransferase involved in cell wall biosynthesis